MTLNAVIALILRFFSRDSTDFQADYITVVEDYRHHRSIFNHCDIIGLKKIKSNKSKNKVSRFYGSLCICDIKLIKIERGLALLLQI